VISASPEERRDEARAADPIGELCEAIRAALLYSVFAEQAAREGDSELHEFYRSLETDEEERAERARSRLMRVLTQRAGDAGDDDAL